MVVTKILEKLGVMGVLAPFLGYSFCYFCALDAAGLVARYSLALTERETLVTEKNIMHEHKDRRMLSSVKRKKTVF